MSQNKTVIQGLEPVEAPNQNNGAGSNFYTRGGYSGNRGTVVPGMMETPGSATQNPRNPAAASQQPKKSTASGKPVSRTAAGEYWPLHIGQNTIGQNPSSDIVLSEGTVSSDHAVLVVRKMKNPEKIIASISDARSTNGTMINGESLGFSAVECKNGDIITVGDNYELYLILVDAPTLGLSVSENFIALESEETNSYYEDQSGPAPAGYTRPGEGFQSYGGPTAPPPFGGGFTPGGTIGLDGSTSSDKGGTVGM